MKYIQGEDRRQYVLFPACLDQYIEQDNPVRYIDAFVDSQDLEKNDFDDERKFGRDESELNLEVVQNRQADYKEYRNHLEESGEKQLSLTDPDSKLKKFNDGFNVGYNIQTAVEADSHLIDT